LKELKKLFIIYINVLSLFGSGLEYLNTENRDMLSIQSEIDNINEKKLKQSWIEPVVASYTYTKGKKTDTIYYKVSLSQPIFKSGGIYFAIKYAEANGKFKKLSNSITQNSLIKRVYELVLRLKKLDVRIKKTNLNLKNIKLDIEKKKERFLKGVDDISFLDKVMLRYNDNALKLEDLKTTRRKLLKTFNNISPYKYSEIKLPTLKVVTKDEFLRKNLDLKKSKANITKLKELKNITISKYLPTVSLFGNYNYKKIKRVNTGKWKNDNFKNYGVMVKMSLSINEGRDMEIKRLEALKAKLSYKQKQRELKNVYESIYEDLKFLNAKAKVTKDSIRIYKELVKSTKSALKAGDKTHFDLKTVLNSKKVLEYDLDIIEYDKKLSLLKLYEKMSDSL